ncbi:MAG: hypothetical protein C3F13_02820 [Anaerolineales bacterium]|nr:MAG: hypothetical protein C3F13_02820 [Anaerolineales bacterium]
MASYDFNYAIESLRQAVDFAEIEHDFVPLRKLVNEVEQSGQDLMAIDGRLNLSAGRDVLMATLQSVAAGSVSPDEALLGIRRWLNSSQAQAVETELAQQYQFA